MKDFFKISEAKQRKVLQAIIVGYLIANLFFLFYEGIWRSVDTTRYLQQSERLLNGQMQGVGYYYLSYVVVVSVF